MLVALDAQAFAENVRAKDSRPAPGRVLVRNAHAARVDVGEGQYKESLGCERPENAWE
jgi:hypothetical protein